MLPRIITRLVGWAVALFYDVERLGPELPDGPVLLAANHPNALVDPLVIFRTAGRPTRPLGKAPLFEQALVGTVLKGLGGLPVYRRQDDPALMHLNDRTFDAAIGALLEGGAVQIYPEGQSHSEPAMAPLRTGAARIALMAEERAGWSLGLHIQPVGLTYSRKHLFRGRVVAAFGAPIPVASFRDEYVSDGRAAVTRLTAWIREELERVTLNFTEREDLELVEVAERLYAREKGLERAGERPSLGTRLPRLQRFASGLNWLRDEDPKKLAELKHLVGSYMRLLALFGATEGEVPHRYRLTSVLSYGARQLLFLVVVAPPAALGTVVWSPPYWFTKLALPWFDLALDQIASFKLAMGLVAFPTWLAAIVAVLWMTVGSQAAWVSALLFTVAGFATIAWRDRGAVIREDLRVFLRVRGRDRALARLKEMRKGLVAEFDAVAELSRAASK